MYAAQNRTTSAKTVVYKVLAVTAIRMGSLNVSSCVHGGSIILWQSGGLSKFKAVSVFGYIGIHLAVYVQGIIAQLREIITRSRGF